MQENTAIIVLCTIFSCFVVLSALYVYYKRLQIERADAAEGQEAFSKWIQYYGEGSERAGGGVERIAGDTEGNFSAVNPMMLGQEALGTRPTSRGTLTANEASSIVEDSIKLRRTMDLHKLSVKRLGVPHDSAARASVAHYQSAQGSTQIPSVFIPAIPEKKEIGRQSSQKILLKTSNQENL